MTLNLDDYSRLPAKRMAAGALILSDGKALLVEPSYKESFEIPGGIIENNESPREALIREIKEELSLTVSPGRLLVVEYQHGDREKTESIMFVFEVQLSQADETQISLCSQELRSWRYVAKDDWKKVLVRPLARRLEIACEALKAKTPRYVEDGIVVG